MANKSNSTTDEIAGLHQIQIGRLEDNPSTIVLILKDQDGVVFKVNFPSSEIAKMIGSLISQAAVAIPPIPQTGKANISVSYVVPTDSVGFGKAGSETVLYIRTGGFDLVFSAKKQALIDMSRKLIKEADGLPETKMTKN